MQVGPPGHKAPFTSKCPLPMATRLPDPASSRGEGRLVTCGNGAILQGEASSPNLPLALAHCETRGLKTDFVGADHVPRDIYW